MCGGRRWTARRQLDGDGRQWTARQRLESNGRIDGNGQRLDGDGRRGGTSMDGAMAPQQRWMVRWLLDGDRVRDSVIATVMVMDCDHNGDGQRWTVMDGTMAT